MEESLANEMLQAAVIRCVEVIGEAARQVSDSTRKQEPDIPWHLIIGMRNILAHKYGAVDLKSIFSVVTKHVPDLLERLNVLIASLEKEIDWRED